MDLIHLRSFVAVAEERSFSRAAARLHIAPSPLSRRIKDLEREFGASLFVRAHHRVDLTEAGGVLLPRAVDIVERVDALADVVGRAGARTTRRAVIGIAPEVSATVRDTFLADLAALHPDIVPRLLPASSEPLLRDLRAGHIDLALVHGPVRGAGIRSLFLERQPVGVAVGTAAIGPERTSVALSDLADIPFASITHDAAPEIYRNLDELLDRHGIRKRITLTGDNFVGLAHLVATGQAFTLVGLGAGMANRLFIGEPVRILPIDGVRARITTVAAWRTNREEGEELIADLVDTVAGLDQKDSRPQAPETI
ncbi:LysR family transcriptional regulator [Gordonia sp. OPL2]|uniref:LysR family transcriptional regulator n=1 Tax=Gordonia sp. OPL2 TaxID=2486274 RepID=UPI00165515C1|nr:LysR family transcriptional regulator [Gordonia sp. OPL2]RPA19808.1 LysR family transcriptional regulator [Gordonia sp. OPL2]